MRPLMLKGHGRPLTQVKFNREGDLLFTCAKDYTPCVWYTHNGERLGTYNGHNGSVWSCDISWNSDRLLTGSSDTKAMLWDAQHGTKLFEWSHESVVRCVGFALGERMMLTCQDNSFNKQTTIFIYNLVEDLNAQETAPVRAMTQLNQKKINACLWGPRNETIISGDDGGFLRVWDVEVGKEIAKIEGHRKAIQDVQFSKDHTMLITASTDQSAKLWDTKALITQGKQYADVFKKEFLSDRPINSAAISPTHPYIILGGGQEAMAVTTTAAAAGKFETDFHHVVYEKRLGSVKGHFGPINTLAFTPDGRSFVSGSEDGYVRLHHFDKDYFQAKQW